MILIMLSLFGPQFPLFKDWGGGGNAHLLSVADSGSGRHEEEKWVHPPPTHRSTTLDRPVGKPGGCRGGRTYLVTASRTHTAPPLPGPAASAGGRCTEA